MDKVILHTQGLLGEWWCVDASLNEQEVIDAVAEKYGPRQPVMADRFYGGFRCGDRDRCHVYHETGAYSYLSENVPVTDVSRQRTWHNLIEHNRQDGRDGFIGGGPFCSDAPIEEEA